MSDRARMAGKRVSMFMVLLLSAAGVALAQTRSERERKTTEQPATAQNASTVSTANEAPRFKGMKYRVIGPFRGGRSLTASGIAGDPTTYYFGATGGGVWRPLMALSPGLQSSTSKETLLSEASRSRLPIPMLFT